MNPVIERDDLQLLAEVGMLAAQRGDVAAAQTIFAALQQERPGSAAGYVGPALALLFRGRAAEAIGELQRGLPKVEASQQQDLQALLGFALQVEGRGSESQQALQAARDHPVAAALLAQGQHLPLGG